MIKEIKSIPLASFLSRLGHEPAARKGTRLWYKSPLRQEHTPSFKVETALNCWYDFGLGRGGNIIDLAAELYQTTDLRHILRCIADSYPVPSVPTIASSFAPRHSAPSMERFEVVPLEHRALVAYLQERGIPAHIAKAKCKEAHYCVNGRFYFAVAFENVSGGWELRYPNVWISFATDISKVAGEARTSHISRGRETDRQQSVPCSRDLLITSLPSPSTSSADPTQSYSTRLSMSTRLCHISKITTPSTATLTTTMPDKQHSPS